MKTGHQEQEDGTCTILTNSSWYQSHRDWRRKSDYNIFIRTATKVAFLIKHNLSRVLLGLWL